MKVEVIVGTRDASETHTVVSLSKVHLLELLSFSSGEGTNEEVLNQTDFILRECWQI